jgi:hypothetical protein
MEISVPRLGGRATTHGIESARAGGRRRSPVWTQLVHVLLVQPTAAQRHRWGTTGRT